MSQHPLGSYFLPLLPPQPESPPGAEQAFPEKGHCPGSPQAAPAPVPGATATCACPFPREPHCAGARPQGSPWHLRPAASGPWHVLCPPPRPPSVLLGKPQPSPLQLRTPASRRLFPASAKASRTRAVLICHSHLSRGPQPAPHKRGFAKEGRASQEESGGGGAHCTGRSETALPAGGPAGRDRVANQLFPEREPSGTGSR